MAFTPASFHQKPYVAPRGHLPTLNFHGQHVNSQHCHLHPWVTGHQLRESRSDSSAHCSDGPQQAFWVVRREGYVEPATGLGALDFALILEVSKAKDFIQKQKDNRKIDPWWELILMAQVDWTGRWLDSEHYPSGWRPRENGKGECTASSYRLPWGEHCSSTRLFLQAISASIRGPKNNRARPTPTESHSQESEFLL